MVALWRGSRLIGFAERNFGSDVGVAWQNGKERGKRARGLTTCASAAGRAAAAADQFKDSPRRRRRSRPGSSKRWLGSSANWDALQITGYIYWARIVLLYVRYSLPKVEEAVPLSADGRHCSDEMA